MILNKIFLNLSGLKDNDRRQKQRKNLMCKSQTMGSGRED